MSLDVDGTFLFHVLEPLTPGDTRPVSVQVAERICQAIEGGRFRQGQRLPTTSHVSGRYRTTPGVASAALRRVVTNGYATAAPGKRGYYVRGVTPRQRPSQTSSECVDASPHAAGMVPGPQRGEPAPARVRLSHGHSDPDREGVSRFPPPEDTRDPLPARGTESH